MPRPCATRTSGALCRRGGTEGTDAAAEDGEMMDGSATYSTASLLPTVLSFTASCTVEQPAPPGAECQQCPELLHPLWGKVQRIEPCPVTAPCIGEVSAPGPRCEDVTRRRRLLQRVDGRHREPGGIIWYGEHFPLPQLPALRTEQEDACGHEAPRPPDCLRDRVVPDGWYG